MHPRRAVKVEYSMDADNLAHDSAKSPKLEQTTDRDSEDRVTLPDVDADLEPEHSEFDDPGFRSIWVMLIGLGIFLAAAGFVISIS